MSKISWRARIALGFCLLAVMAPAPASGWEEDRVFVLRYLHVPRSDFQNEEGEIQMDSVRAEGIVPLDASDTTAVFGGLAYHGLFLDYRDLVFTPEDGLGEDDLAKDLHVLDLVLGGSHDWDEHWSAFLILYPGVHSDFENLDGKDLYFSGAALASYRVSEDLTLSGGAYYDDSFGYPRLLPMLGIQWRIDAELTLEALLPQFLVFSWQLSPRLALGLKGSVEGNQYRLKEGSPWKDTVVEYTQILAGPFADLRLAGDLFLRLEGGFVFNREFEFRDDDSDRKLFDGDIDNSAYAGASLSYRY